MMTTDIDVMLNNISFTVTTNAATHSNMTQRDTAAVQCTLHVVQHSLNRSLPDHGLTHLNVTALRRAFQHSHPHTPLDRQLQHSPTS